MYHKSEAEIMATWQFHNESVVSVCSITYNHEPYIAQALDSFLMQETTFPFEIVVGEDCSTDNTMTILKQYQEKYPNIIRIITSEHNVGVNANFLRALQACQGKYIALCEGDDYWTDPTKLQKQFDCLEVNSQASCCFHKVSTLNINGLFSEIKPRDAQYYEYSRQVAIFHYPRIKTQSIMFCNNPEILSLLDSKEYRRVVSADTFLFAILAMFGSAIYIPNIDCSVYRIHNGGIWSSQSVKIMHAETMNNTFWLAIFMDRLGYKKEAKYFHKRAFRVHTRLVPIGYQFAMAFLRIFKFLGKKR